MGFEEVSSVLNTIAEGSTIVCLLLILPYRNRSKVWKLLTYYLFLLSALYLFTTVLGWYKTPNWWVYQLIGLIELVIAFLFYQRLGLEKGWKYAFYGVLTLYLVDTAYVVYRDTMILRENADAEAYYANPIGQSIMLMFTLTLGIHFLYQLYKRDEDLNLIKHPPFLLNAAFLFYSALAFYGYLISTEIITKASDDFLFDAMWLIVSVGIVIKNLLFWRASRLVSNGS